MRFSTLEHSHNTLYRHTRIFTFRERNFPGGGVLRRRRGNTAAGLAAKSERSSGRPGEAVPRQTGPALRRAPPLLGPDWSPAATTATAAARGTACYRKRCPSSAGTGCTCRNGPAAVTGHSGHFGRPFRWYRRFFHSTKLRNTKTWLTMIP